MPFTLKESDVLTACLEYLALRGVLAWRSNNTGVFDPARKCFRSFRGLKGVADILGILPGGRLLAVECKRPGGVMSENQVHFQRQIAERGGVALCVSSVAELERGLPVFSPLPFEERGRG